MSRILPRTSSYVSVHMWVAYHYGKANHCENNPSHKSKRFEWANLSGEYKREISDWKQLCIKCHRKLDQKSECKNGHEFTDDNVYILPSRPTVRNCRKCQRESLKKYLERRRNVKN